MNFRQKFGLVTLIICASYLASYLASHKDFFNVLVVLGLIAGAALFLIPEGGE